ncbi:hypothetical protein P154DRAFT_524759 [Amniculicola lignicola CBS 123094]|uniref:Pentacotripeptide-repeat region of PRORP domain-containing protein n=1 Tax=Amniculicola lignicola CBS 123094 TaxID=1392246 RepID=A0A6A5W6L6_9PLEO|nr:hypothetical protein P154DRAFT_524759 [Amniculicola lignicola CBS 123094]
MPRALRPDGRCFAVFDAPFLPFLAPRVFAQPATRRALGRGDGPWKEQGAVKATSSAVYEGDGRPPRCSRVSSQRYADIFALTRHHHRFYSTAGGIRPEEIVEAAESRCIAAIEPQGRADKSRNAGKVTMQRGNVESKRFKSTRLSNSPRTTRTGAPTGHQIRAVMSTSERDRGLLNLRRTRWLDKTLKHEATFLPYATSPDPLSMNGRYRSLCRRKFSFSCTSATTIDMVTRVGLPLNDMATPAFAALDSKIFSAAKRNTFPIRLAHDRQWDDLWFAKLFGGTEPSADEAVWENWRALDPHFRDALWRPFLFFLLDLHPARALQFIRVVGREESIPTAELGLLADGLEHLARLCLHTPSSMSNPATVEMLIPTFFYVFERHLSKCKTMCSQHLFVSLAKVASRLQHVDDLKRVWELLTTTNALLGYDTRLHFSNEFAKLGELELALLCLKRAIEVVTGRAAPIIANRRRFIWSCALILRSAGKQGHYHRTSECVTIFLRLGVKLDILLHNVIIHNAVEAKDYATAFRVYNLLEENRLVADEHTYAILLHGCTMSDDPARFHDFAEHCAQIAREMRYPWLATDYLYYLYMRDEKHDGRSDQVLQLLSRAYSQFFAPGPLVHFGLRRVESGPQDDSGDTVRLQPSQVSLYLMLQLRIRQAMEVSPKALLDLYIHFKSILALHEHPSLDELARNPIIWNAFLLAFCQRQQFASASQLIKDMTNGPVEGTAQPNTHTWNIFMYAFFETGQVRAAERVYKIMTDRGAEPDQFTFTVLLKGYASAQQPEQLGAVLQHADTETQLNPQVLRAMTRMTDQKALMLQLEKVRVEKAEKERNRAAHEVERQQKRWHKNVWSRNPLLRLQSPVEQGVVSESEKKVGKDAESQLEPVSSHHPTHVPAKQPSFGSVVPTSRPDPAIVPDQEPFGTNVVASKIEAKTPRSTQEQRVRLSRRPKIDSLVRSSSATRKPQLFTSKTEVKISGTVEGQPARLSHKPNIDSLVQSSTATGKLRSAAIKLQRVRLSRRPSIDSLVVPGRARGRRRGTMISTPR